MSKRYRRILTVIAVTLFALVAVLTALLSQRHDHMDSADKRTRVKAGLSNAVSIVDDQSSASQTTDIRLLVAEVSSLGSRDHRDWLKCPLSGRPLLFHPDQAVWDANLGERRWDSDEDLLVISPTLVPSEFTGDAVFLALTASAKFVEIPERETPDWLGHAIQAP